MSKESAAGVPGKDKDVLDAFLGTRAIQEGLVTPDQVKEALAEQARDLGQRKSGPYSLGAILVAKGFLTHDQLQSLILAKSKPLPAGAPKYPPFGKYTLVRELGRGGMGIVYEAVDVGLGRKVALKTMILSPLANPADAKKDEERFLREAQLSARLPKHPHIVGVYEAGVIQERRYLAMELIEGRPMSEWREGKSVTLRQEVEVLRSVALAVHHAHEHDVIHRDLKPQNILIDGKDEPHITDFGLAKMVGQDLSVSLTGAGMVVGTPAYISPEQAQGLKTTDRRTDVYALGVMLFEIVTGRHPFVGETAMEIMMKAAKNPVPSATKLMKVQLSPGQAKGLDDICHKALAKKPGERYRDAAAFAGDLTRWLKGEEVKVHLQTRRMMRPVRRNWTAVAAAAILAVGIGAWLLRGSPAPEVDSEAQRKARAVEDKKRKDQEEKNAADRRVVEERAMAAENALNAIKAGLLKAVVIKNPESLRPGFIAEYCGGANFDIPCLRRIDPEIGFLWGKGGPAWPDGPSDVCSLRWRAVVRVPETTHYAFQVGGNDGVRLFIDNAEVISRWVPNAHGGETGVCYLEQGHHTFVLECFKAGPRGGIAFSWKKANESGENLPSSLFFHDPAGFTPLSQKWAIENTDQKGLPGAQEAEKLPILESLPSATFVLPWGREKGFLLWGKGKPGDRLKLQFTSPESGEKTLFLALGHAKNSGIVRIAANGKDLAKSLDLYHTTGHFFLEHEFKKVLLRKGANELEFTMMGSNPQAVEWNKGDGLHKMSFDYLRIR